MRLRLDLAYDGTDFHGWATQPGTRTVQDTLEHALQAALRLPAPVPVTVAGRTDAGVHARGQVTHADVPEHLWQAGSDVALRRLNGVLPTDVRVLSIGPSPAGFDARFSALWRRYSYRVCDDQAKADPLRRRDTLWYRWPLDVSLLNQAAGDLLGEHDFAAYCRPRPGATTVRELIRFDWQRDERGVVIAAIVADAFCHNMVRALAGALLAVGDGRRPPGWPAEVLAGRARDPAVTVLPPHPLCLEQVGYPADADLAARAELTRRIRSGPGPEA